MILPDLPRNQSNDFPTLQTVLQQNNPFPQPPPLLNGILLLDQMLANNSSSGLSNERTQTTSNHGGWYNLTSNYQTKASVV